MGKLQFTISPLTSAVAASQAKYEADGIYASYRMRVDDLRAIGNYTSSRFDNANKDGYTLQCYSQDGTYELSVFSSTQGTLAVASQLLSELPANGNDIVIYVAARPAGLAIAVGSPDGTVIHSGTNATGGWAGGAGSGNVALGGASGDSIFVLDCYARFSAIRTGNSRFAKPVIEDADVLGVYYFGEETGTTAADSEGGTSLTLTSPTWSTDDGWEAIDPDPPEFTSLDIDDPNLTYELGELLDPITVTKLDQYDDPTSLGPTEVTITSLSLPVPVSGTTTESFVGAVAVFDNLTVAAAETPPAELGEGGGGGAAPGGGLLRFYLTLERQQERRERKVARTEKRVLYEADALQDDGESLVAQVERAIAGMPVDGTSPDILNTLFNLK